MKAFFAVFLEFREGKIFRQRKLRLFRGLVAEGSRKYRGSTRVLLLDTFLWYGCAIV
jgi:hypothetical protein